MSDDIEKIADNQLDKKPEFISVKKSTYNKLIVGIIAAVVISVFLGGYILGSGTAGHELVIKDSKDVTGQTPANQPQSNLSPGIISVSLDDDPVKGDPNAPITMIEFSDFECPFCARFFTTTLPLIEKNYIETGKVKFVYRDFPLTDIHQNALPAAMAAECANEQGKFWELHDKIFENQKQWEGPDVQNGVRTFEQFAAELGLDTDKFNSCLESGKYLEEVQKDLNDGASYGVTGTPGFFIGNEKIGYGMVSGAQPYSAFQQVLDQLLAK
ncbi:MAG: DsbA family protein [Nitrosopumilaceae archaeon]